MNIKAIGYQPAFQARFIKNELMMNSTRTEVESGYEEELDHALKDLSKHHSNVALLLSKTDSNEYEVFNLFNNNSVIIPGFNSDTISELSNVKSPLYKTLFNKTLTMTPGRANQITNTIANKYFVTHSPDYTLGRKLEGIV